MPRQPTGSLLVSLDNLLFSFFLLTKMTRNTLFLLQEKSRSCYGPEPFFAKDSPVASEAIRGRWWETRPNSGLNWTLCQMRHSAVAVLALRTGKGGHIRHGPAREGTLCGEGGFLVAPRTGSALCCFAHLACGEKNLGLAWTRSTFERLEGGSALMAG